jgi:hypothetical protein
MDFGVIISRFRRVTADNAPTILTAVGVTGAVTTAIFAGKASFKAAEVLHNEALSRKKFDVPPIENKEIVPLVWKLYVPAIGTGIITVVSIIAANHISVRRASALASAYTLSQEAVKEYKSKVLDKIGEKKEQAVRDEIAQDRVNNNPPGAWILVGTDVLCLDLHSGRYFDSDMEKIRAAVNDTNFQIIRDDSASLTDFWERLGLARTTESDEIGWNTDKQLEVRYASALVDGKPCLTIEFTTTPLRGYYKHH